MTMPTKPHLHSRFTPSNDVDGLLTRFFQAALPEPWPVCPTPAAETATMLPLPKSGSSRWVHIAGRVAVAAAMAGLVVGYLGLQSSFPDPRPDSHALGRGPGFAFRPLVPGLSIDQTKSGMPVTIEIKQMPDPKTKWLHLELPDPKQKR
jgi:hypothetical protein